MEGEEKNTHFDSKKPRTDNRTTTTSSQQENMAARDVPHGVDVCFSIKI
jgi:hypothetical protein